MAGRISRRQQIADRNNNSIPEKQTAKMIFRAGIYLRLSLLDGGYGKECESLENQELLIRDYISRYPEIEIASIYTDNGDTGTDFMRSDFNRLMDDIRCGKINCIVVKDLSRFGRSYLETEEYLEKIFPFLGIRFIAVNDNIDTFSSEYKADSLTRSMKNLMNEAYSRDLSKKIGSAFDAKRANGEMIYRTVPYGYEKSGDPKHPYRIDKDAASNIRMFFEMYADGYNIGEIAEHCKNKGLLSPQEYRASKGLGGKRNKKYGIWRKDMIAKILRNPVYLGHMFQQKSYKRFCDNQPNVYYPKDQWKFYENVNEPIITKELWDRVQSMLPIKPRSAPIDCPERHKESFVAGLFYCKCCGKPLARCWKKTGKYYMFSCRTHLSYGNAGCRNLRSIIEREAEKIVTEQIRTQLELLGVCIRTVRPYDTAGKINEFTKLDSRIRALETELSRKKTSLMNLFEQLCSGEISELQYVHYKEEAESDIAEAEFKISECIEEKVRISKEQPINNFIEKVLEYKSDTEINKEIVDTLVERIDFDIDRTITVQMKYQDIFQDFINCDGASEVDKCSA